MTEVQVQGKVIKDDVPGTGDSHFEDKQKLRTKGWQVVSIPANVPETPQGMGYIQLTDNRYARCVINVYKPGQHDEMHCHPGSEHIFMVFQGELHISGINDGEDLVLKPGELVHINQSYYYQLINDTEEETILYAVFTKPPKPPKITRYSYRGPGGVDPATLEGQ